jgi:transposase
MQGRQEYQPELFSEVRMESLIPDKHLLRRIDGFMDFSFIREMTLPLYCENNGRPSVDPELFFRICLITYLYNIPSDRQVCEEIQYNLAYRWFCKLSFEDKVPDHSSLTRSRDRLGEECFREIFERLIRMCLEKGVIKGTKVMMDGKHVKADAALNSLVPKDENGNTADVESEDYILGKKFSNETHVSKTDPDATLAGKVGEPKKLRYKVHNTADRKSRIILDTHVTTGSEVEGKVGLSRIDAIEENFGIEVEELTADRGYGYGVNLDDLEDREIKSFVPNFRPDVGDQIDPDIFTYNKDKDAFRCAQGHWLERKTTDEQEKENYLRRYKIKSGICFQCPMSQRCFEKPPTRETRKSVGRNLHWKIQAKTKRREKTKLFRQALGERQWKMEGLFAEGKIQHGLDHARYRGRSKMQIQAYMTAFVQNLKRLLEIGLSLTSDLVLTIWIQVGLYGKLLLGCDRNRSFSPA